MIYPTAKDILRCVDQTLADASDIELPRMAVKSALATCRPLIRHVDLRLQLEAGILRDDLVLTADLLGHVADFINNAGVADMAPLGQRIAAVLADQDNDPTADGGDGMDALQARVLVRRELAYSALAALQKLPPAIREQDSYRSLRQRFLDYISAELAQEGRMITPAFLGKGPRR